MAEDMFAPQVIRVSTSGPTNYRDASGGTDDRGPDGWMSGPGGDLPPGSWPGGQPPIPKFNHTEDAPRQIQQGVNVGSWVPFSNYMNTQAPPTQSVTDKRPPQTPGGEQLQDQGQPLVAGPGLGGYYGQISQQYLTQGDK